MIIRNEVVYGIYRRSGQKSDSIVPWEYNEHISENSYVRVIDEYIKQLDLEGLGFKKAVRPIMGRPPYNPKDMLNLE